MMQPVAAAVAGMIFMARPLPFLHRAWSSILANGYLDRRRWIGQAAGRMAKTGLALARTEGHSRWQSGDRKSLEIGGSGPKVTEN